MTALSTARPLTTPFGATSTASDVLAGLDLTGRRVVVTGATSGIGLETARALAGAGAEVTLGVRDPQAGARAAEDLTATTGSQRIRVERLDLADSTSVAAFVDAWHGPLHALVNNAGVMATPQQHTLRGWELQLATNHLGHFALATGLHPALALAQGARVVAVSSTAHLRSPVVFGDLQFEKRPYDPWLAYGQSKTANVLFAVEANRRWADDGITVNALNPGGIRTNLQRHLDAEQLQQLADRGTATGMVWKTAEQGAATSTLLAASPLLEGIGGRYFEDCNQAAPHQPGSYRGVAEYALDPEAATLLWQLSLDLLAA